MRTFTFLLILLGSSAQAQQVVQARGVDGRVDYAGLTRFGPWDDRNYALTAEDVALLGPNEAQLGDPIPAFYRIAYRKWMRDNGHGKVELYPRVLFNTFRMHHGGYLVDGLIYRNTERDENGRFSVVREAGITEEELLAAKALEGDVRVTSPNGAAETAIKINPVDTNVVIAGSNGPGSGQKMHYSTNGGETWTQVSLPLGGTCCDPAVDWSSDGVHGYAATLGSCGFLCDVWAYRTDNGGQTWTGLESITPGDPRRELTNSDTSDKEYLHVDKHLGSPCVDNLYMSWHDNNTLKHSRSTDRGHTWSTPLAVFQGSAIGSDITSDKNGNVYHFWPVTSGGLIRVQKSTDCGASFGTSGSHVQVADTFAAFDFPIPAMDTRLAFIYVAADADLSSGPFGGSVYAAWTDTTAAESGTAANNHARIQVGYSRDAGATWTVTTPHPTNDSNTVDRFHPWLGVDPQGRVWVAYYDTRNHADRRGTDFYYSVSTDGAQTWSEPARLSSVTSNHITDSFEWGDYNGLDAVMNRVMTIWTDNRSEGSGASVDAYASGMDTGIFSDGFESGDSSAWSATVP